MKLLRYGPSGHELPGLLDPDGAIRDLSEVVGDIGRETLLPASLERLRAIDPSTLPKVAGTPRIGPCVGQVGKFICIGLNYSDHAAETGLAVPTEPIVFMKATTAIIGPNDDVVIPRGSQKTDWEVELGVVIGTPAKYVSEAEALSHVAGYCVVNDLSERAFQLERRRAVDQGQERRHVRADRSLAGHPRRGRRPAAPRHVARGRRSPLPERLDATHGLRRAVPGQLPEPVHEPPARRHHLDRHAAGRRLGQKPPVYLRAGQTSCAWASRGSASRHSASARNSRSRPAQGSLTTSTWLAATLLRTCRAPSGHRISIRCATLMLPSPTCSRTSLRLR